MLQLYPAHAADALEFNKIRGLLLEKCRTDEARARVSAMRFMSRLELIEKALKQTAEFRLTLGGGDYFPGEFTRNLQQELRLITVQGAMLTGDSLAALSGLTKTVQSILLWFKGHPDFYPTIEALTEGMSYEKNIV